jgi:hypothetical protein
MDEINDLINRWKEAKSGNPERSSVATLIAAANRKKKSSLNFHYGNIAVLSGVVVMLVLFFIYLFPFRETLSKTALAFMIGSVVIRIALEIASAMRARQINLTDSALQATTATIRFREFRKTIHGSVTVSLVGIYIIGLFMLTPEFLLHTGRWIYLFDLFFLISAVFLIWRIRKSILKEMSELEEIIALKKELEA